MDNHKDKDKDQLKQMNPGPADGAGSSNQNGPAAGSGPKRSNFFNILTIIFIITFLLNLFVAPSGRGSQIEYSQFIKLVESGLVERVQLDDEQVRLSLKTDADLKLVESILDPAGLTETERQGEISADAIFFSVRLDDPGLVDRLSASDVNFHQLQTRTGSPIMSFITSWILPVLLMYLFYSFLIRRMVNKMGQGGQGMGNIFSAGKSKAKEYSMEKSSGVMFSDVAGQDEAKESLAELADFLHNPAKYKAIGAKQPKGALLVGPPGTGKTLLAKALAGEAKVPFYSISGSEFVEMFVGVGASRVRDLFATAKKNAPCIIFIDEIDAIGKSRDNQLGSNDEREQTLNQLLAEMDGFDGTNGIVILAATNRPEVLDKALLRPGRFDRRILVEKPDLAGRTAILKVHAKKVSLASDIDLEEIALATSGATGADLANMINEGALLAVKENRPAVRQKDLMEAVEVIIAGKEKKDRIMNKKERRMVAYHEVGHALTSALQKNSQPVKKITIVPRTMGSLGYTMNMPEEERYLLTKSELEAQIVSLLGGRAAEILEFGEVSTGAANDIARATVLARSMVTQYGMSDKFGPMGLESIENRYLDGRSVKNISPQTESLVDEEVRLILAESQQKASALLKSNRSALTRISAQLLAKENITGEEFMQLLQDAA